jgi:hypothetical protein
MILTSSGNKISFPFDVLADISLDENLKSFTAHHGVHQQAVDSRDTLL